MKIAIFEDNVLLLHSNLMNYVHMHNFFQNSDLRPKALVPISFLYLL